MKKKLFILILTVITLFSSSCYAVEADIDETTGDYQVINLSGKESTFFGDIKCVDISDFRGVLPDEYYDVVEINTSQISTQYSDLLRDVLDKGSIVLINGASISNSAISLALELPYHNDPKVSGATLTGKFIIKSERDYIIGNIGYAVCTRPEDSAADSDIKATRSVKFDIDRFVHYIRQGMNDVESDEMLARMRHQLFSSADRIPCWIETGYFALIGSGEYTSIDDLDDTLTVYAYLGIAQHRYEEATFNNGNKYQGLTDIKTNFSLTAVDGASVNNYTCAILIPEQNDRVIMDSAYFNNFNGENPVSYSGVSNEEIDLGGPISYTQSISNMTIFNGSTGFWHKYWTVTPSVSVSDTEWALIPSVQILNQNITANCASASSEYSGGIINKGTNEYIIPKITVEDEWNCYYRRGDLNIDGDFSNADLVIMSRIIAGLTVPTVVQQALADYDGDGDIDNADLIALARFIVR